jgi:hypothetical protein
LQIWPADDGQPPESTQFAERPRVTATGLEAATEYRFRVRHRLLRGHGPWSPMASAETEKPRGDVAAAEGEPRENLYRLRIVLAPPRSFLVWTPLAEHRHSINRFKSQSVLFP